MFLIDIMSNIILLTRPRDKGLSSSPKQTKSVEELYTVKEDTNILHRVKGRKEG
jgi:hypothetical protein